MYLNKLSPKNPETFIMCVAICLCSFWCQAKAVICECGSSWLFTLLRFSKNAQFMQKQYLKGCLHEVSWL